MDLSLIARADDAALPALLERCNERSARYGLTLTRTEMLELQQARGDALRDSGRVELGESVLPRLIDAFADSPYLTRENYAPTLARLQELFYAFKTAACETLSDDELLEGMRRAFAGRAAGEADYLAGLTPRELWAVEEPPEGAAWSEE